MTNPPHAEELEVSIFGPGRGECVVVHLGSGEWIVVDSCLDPETEEAVALRYLRNLDVDAASAIKLVVVTHWHDDHIKGVSQVLEAAGGAEFVCSEKLPPTVFGAIATARGTNLDDTGLDEFSAVFEVLLSRRQPHQRKESAGPRWAGEGTLLYQSALDRNPATVTALSPSHGTQTLARYELEDFLAHKNKPQRRAVALSPNQRSIVLWITAGKTSVLLGGDLEESPNPAVGWSAVVASGVRPAGRASIFKVPHHGSENADNSAVWTEMLRARPFALLAPFSSGSKPLPSPDDISRLATRTDRIYCTAPPGGRKPSRRDPMVEKTARDVARNRRVISGDTGQVRLRMPILGESAHPSLELFPPALKLSV